MLKSTVGRFDRLIPAARGQRPDQRSLTLETCSRIGHSARQGVMMS
jgi:hypothetical protein